MASKGARKIRLDCSGTFAGGKKSRATHRWPPIRLPGEIAGVVLDLSMPGASGEDGFIQKPYTADLLARKLKAAIAIP